MTLTYPDDFPTPQESKRHLKIFLQRLDRFCKSHGLIWKLEPQERGAPHYHILIWGADLQAMQEYIPASWYEIAGKGDQNHLAWHMGLLGHGNRHCVQQVYDWKGVKSYATKYLGKTFEVAGWSDTWTGRFWGIANRGNVPFGEKIIKEVPYKDAVQLQRYQRRHAGLKKSNRSMTTFCIVDHWVEKLEI